MLTASALVGRTRALGGRWPRLQHLGVWQEGACAEKEASPGRRWCCSSPLLLVANPSMYFILLSCFSFMLACTRLVFDRPWCSEAICHIFDHPRSCRLVTSAAASHQRHQSRGDTIYLLPMPCWTSSPCWPQSLHHDAADVRSPSPAMSPSSHSLSSLLRRTLERHRSVPTRRRQVRPWFLLFIRRRSACCPSTTLWVILMPTTTVSYSSASTARWQNVHMYTVVDDNFWLVAIAGHTLRPAHFYFVLFPWTEGWKFNFSLQTDK